MGDSCLIITKKIMDSEFIEQNKIIKVGTRKSELALVQTNHVISQLKNLYPEQKFELHKMITMGDRILNISLPKIGEKSLFTKDLEDALSNGTVDFVVHSLKDLPTTLPAGMTVGAVLERLDARDALVLRSEHKGKTLSTLPHGSIIGTSSLRRAAQLNRRYPNLKVENIRGNLNTRLAKLDAENSIFTGIILAHAGLIRLGWKHRINQIIEPEEILYAVGQGALAVECRTTDTTVLGMLKNLVCHSTQCRIIAERSFLKTLGGGCSAPVAVNTILSKTNADDNQSNNLANFNLSITGSVLSLDGKVEIQSIKCCDILIDEQKTQQKVIDDGDLGEQPTKKIKLMDKNEIVEDVAIDYSKNVESSIIDEIVKVNDPKRKCPYLKNEDNSDCISSSGSSGSSGESSSCMKCPLNFAVGQDVMCQCPYLTSSDSILKKMDCKNTSNCSKDRSETLVTVSTGCPFIKENFSKEISNRVSEPTKDISDLNNEVMIGPNKSDEKLFCGLYPHRCWTIDVFEKCEQLGKDLAQQLIDNGALPVMESAQNTIRENK